MPDLSNVKESKLKPVLLFKRLHPLSVLPTASNSGDAGFDLTSVMDVSIPPGERRIVDIGLAVAIPFNFVGFICPRSGLAAKHGITVLNAPGVIDCGYRGELKVILFNTDKENTFVIHAGKDRIAQLVIEPCATPSFAVLDTEELDMTERGFDGFGSTGA